MATACGACFNTQSSANLHFDGNEIVTGSIPACILLSRYTSPNSASPFSDHACQLESPLQSNLLRALSASQPFGGSVVP